MCNVVRRTHTLTHINLNAYAAWWHALAATTTTEATTTDSEVMART